MVTTISSREFNQNASSAKRAAAHGPVYITDRGRPAHVLLAYADYERLLDAGDGLDRLGEPAGVEDIEFVVPATDEPARPAEFG